MDETMFEIPYRDTPSWTTINYEMDEALLSFEATDLNDMSPFRPTHTPRSSCTAYGDFKKISFPKGKYYLPVKVAPKQASPPSPSSQSPTSSAPRYEEKRPSWPQADNTSTPQRPPSPVARRRNSTLKKRRATIKGGLKVAQERIDELAWG